MLLAFRKYLDQRSYAECVHHGNAFDICLRPHKKFDRAIIPTQYGRDAILRVIAPLVKKSGMIHFYTFKKWHQVPVLIEEYEKKGFCVNFFRSCGNVAPGVSRWVFDLIKSDP
jgi:tRNA (guanine37-N1)-methyltransferase